MSNKYMRGSVRINVASNAADDIRVAFARDVRLVGVIIAPNATSTEHATNFATITVTDGTTTLFTWSTDSGADGTLTEGTPAGVGPYGTLTATKVLTASAAASQDIDKNGTYEVVVAQTATGVAVDAIVTLIAEPISP